MYFRKGVLYFILIVFLLCITGCSEKTTVTIPALVVINDKIIPERVKKSLFEENIQEQYQDILEADKIMDQKTKDELSTIYTLDEESGEYIANMKRKDADKEKLLMENLLAIFIKIGYIPLFSEPKAEDLVTMIEEWTEITCLTPKDNPKSVKALDAAGNEKTYGWYNIKAGGKEGWILSDYLLFTSVKETEALVIKTFTIYTNPDCTMTGRLGSCTRGMKITLTGYEYPERNCREIIIYRQTMKTQSGESGWGYEPHILTDAHWGVILQDEVTLYTAPEAMDPYVEKRYTYKKMEFVPLIDTPDTNWYEVIYENKSKKYFIKDGHEVISPKQDDISFASFVAGYYYEAKKTIDPVLPAIEALGPNPDEEDLIEAVAGVKDKQAKIDQLNKTYEEIEDRQNEFPDSIFAGIGTYSLRDFVQNLMIVKDALELAVAVKEPAADEEAEEGEEYEAEADETSGG